MNYVKDLIVHLPSPLFQTVDEGVIDHVLVLIQEDGTTGGLELHGLQGLEEGILVFDVSFYRLKGFHDELGGHVSAVGQSPGVAVVFLPIGSDKPLVLRGVVAEAVAGIALDAHHVVALGRKVYLVRHALLADELQLVLEPVLRILVDELDRVAPGEKGPNPVDLARVRAQLCQVRREVARSEGRPHIGHNLAAHVLEDLCEAVAFFMACRIIRADHDDLARPHVGVGIPGSCPVLLAVAKGRPENVGALLLLREPLGPCIGDHERHLLLVDVIPDRIGYGAADYPSENLDLVLFYQFPRLRKPDLGLTFRLLVEKDDVPARHLVSVFVEAHFEAVSQVGPKGGKDPDVRGHKADLYRLCGRSTSWTRDHQRK